MPVSLRGEEIVWLLNFAPRKNKNFFIIRGHGIYDVRTEKMFPTERNLVRFEREFAYKCSTVQREYETEIDHIMVQKLEEYRSCWVAWFDTWMR